MIDPVVIVQSLDAVLGIFSVIGFALMLGSRTTGCAPCGCSDCCWKITAAAGCPSPLAKWDAEAMKMTIYFQDSDNCAGDCDNPSPPGQSDRTPCKVRQAITMKATWKVPAETQVTITLKGNFECVASAFDFTTVKLSRECGDEPFVAFIGASDGQTGCGTCSMNSTTKTPQFTLAAGCWEVEIDSDTRDGLWHYNMVHEVEFSFTNNGKPTCNNDFCTSFSCNQPACVPQDSEQGGQTLSECIAECSTGKCVTKLCYCCVEQEGGEKKCVRTSVRKCDTDALGAGDCPEGAFDTLAECEESCDVSFNCENDKCVEAVGGQYADRAACEEECGDRFECNANAECVPSNDPAAPYANRAACEAECIKKYTCAPDDTCVPSPDGEYNTLVQCQNNCEEGDGGTYFCCYDTDPALGPTGTHCQVGPCGKFENGKFVKKAELVASGPHKGKAACDDSCRRHACGVDACGAPECKPQAGGQHATKQACFQACQDPAQNPCALNPAAGNYGVGNHFFTTDAAVRDICAAYISKNNKPIRVQIFAPTLDQNCNVVAQRVVKSDSGWRAGLPKACFVDCDPKPVPIAGGPKGFVKWRKPRGITAFEVQVLDPCDDADVDVYVDCGKCREIAEEPEPVVFACCLPDGTCLDRTQAQCKAAGGKWTACKACAEVDCETPRGACCDTAECLCKDGTTQAECEDGGGIYQGDGSECDQVVCPLPPARGACCFEGKDCIDCYSKAECEAFGGEYKGDRTRCKNVCCGGVCCLPGNNCSTVQLTETECDMAGGRWQFCKTCQTADCRGCSDCYPQQIVMTVKKLSVIENPFDGPVVADGQCIDEVENAVFYNNQGGTALNTTKSSLDYRVANDVPIVLERNGCAKTWSGSVVLPEQWWFQGRGTTLSGCREVSVGASASITTEERQVLCFLVGGAGSGATAEPSVSGGGVSGITLTDGGGGYAYRQLVQTLVIDTLYVSVGGDGDGATATATVITTPGPDYGKAVVTITNGGSGYSYAYINIYGNNEYGWECWPGEESGYAVISEGVVTGYSQMYPGMFIRTCQTPTGPVVVDAPDVIVTGTGSGVVATAVVDGTPSSPNFGKVVSVTVDDPGSGYETGLFSYISIGLGQLRIKANWEQNCNLPAPGLPCPQPVGEYTTTEPCAVSLFKEYDVVWGSRFSGNAGTAPGPVACPNASPCHLGHYGYYGGFFLDAPAFPDTGMGQMKVKVEIA